jgi:hypothetical protein
MEEITTLISQAWEQYSALGPAVAAEEAAGIPPVSGTSQALRWAVFDHIMQLYEEQVAVRERKCTSCTQCSLCRGSSRAEVVVCCGKAPDACVVGAMAAACEGSLRELAGVMGMTLLCPASLLPRPLICRTVHSILPRLTSSSRPACCRSCRSRSEEGEHQCSAHAPTHPTAAAGAGGTDRLAGMMIACMWCCVRHPRQPKGLACWLADWRAARPAGNACCLQQLSCWPLTRTLPAPASAATKSIPEQRCDSGVEPSAPTGGSSGLSQSEHGSGTSEETAAVSGAVDSEALPLLAGGAAVGPPAGVSAPGLRRRPGQHQALE